MCKYRDGIESKCNKLVFGYIHKLQVVWWWELLTVISQALYHRTSYQHCYHLILIEIFLSFNVVSLFTCIHAELALSVANERQLCTLVDHTNLIIQNLLQLWLYVWMQHWLLPTYNGFSSFSHSNKSSNRVSGTTSILHHVLEKTITGYEKSI